MWAFLSLKTNWWQCWKKNIPEIQKAHGAMSFRLRKDKKDNLQSLRKAALHCALPTFYFVLYRQFGSAHRRFQRFTNIYLSFFLPSFLYSRGEIVKWPSQSNPPRIAVSKQLRIRIFWKESVGMGIFSALSISSRSAKFLPENFRNDFSVFDSDIDVSLSFSFLSGDLSPLLSFHFR